MDNRTAKELMELFFQAPAANGLLVFEDNDYLGVVFKRDIEMGMSEGGFEISGNINFLRMNELSGILFKNGHSGNASIPVVDREGKLLRVISRSEFQCHFLFDEFLDGFHETEALDYLDHPLVITSHFKKTIYANKNAVELFEKEIVGKNFAHFLQKYHFNIAQDAMIMEKEGVLYRLVISQSLARDGSFFLYQFFRV